MDILNSKNTKNSFTKPEMEMVEDEKVEYKLIGKYFRTRGLKLFAYNYQKDQLIEITTSLKTEIALVIGNDGKLGKSDSGKQECQVDSRDTHFEALNQKSALKRLQKYKEGKIKELCNLRVPVKNSLKLF